ncbi:MAG: NUDIX domain-containing protein [Microscillaceae bacterium]|jgi:ADP-ribose pyrophosphatase YjhB (NUDIX family)|nr:NUDIX domain-containing protein [Microscillaceae bacterium]
MDIFINHTHLTICSPERFRSDLGYNYSLDLGQESLKYNLLHGKVLLKNPSQEQVKELVQLIIADKFVQLDSITFLTNQFTEIKESLKKDFRIIHAGGGLVQRSEQYLWIYRLKKWDLPKGKRDDNEKFKDTAVREVEEECNIKVALDKKICTTWHYYTTNGGKEPTLKKTKWYLMTCLDDSKMKPQIEEDIEDIRWLMGNALAEALQDTYPAIRFVFASLKNS